LLNGGSNNVYETVLARPGIKMVDVNGRKVCAGYELA
jgi:transglutaminase/protease-like cytokinesis protein 3